MDRGGRKFRRGGCRPIKTRTRIQMGALTVCSGKPNGETKYRWNEDMAPLWNESDSSMCYVGAYSHPGNYSDSPPIQEFPKWDCVHCGSVNRWMAGDPPPNKCRSCGAPEKARAEGTA